MTLGTLGQLLDRLLEEKEGSEGFWHGQRDGVTIYVVADEEHDRMRIMSPIGEMRKADPGFLSILLQANFDRALDAKYALRKREVWSVFMHPMSTLVPDDLGTFIDQVARLVKNTGTTYASSDLVFGVDDETEARLDMDYEVDLDGDGDEEGDGDGDADGDDRGDDSDGDEDVVALEKDDHRHPKRPTAQEVIDLSGILDSGIDDEDEDEDDEDQKRRRRARP
jgi:hypothetical protein